jgi:hypothetical protein
LPPTSPPDIERGRRFAAGLIDVERSALVDLRDEGRISLSVLREVERDLDLEQERLSRTAVPRGSQTPEAALR